MMIKALNITLGVLVGFSVWCAALMFAIFVAITAVHILLISGLTVYHLMNS